jgi:hypothetical protein
MWQYMALQLYGSHNTSEWEELLNSTPLLCDYHHLYTRSVIDWNFIMQLVTSYNSDNKTREILHMAFLFHSFFFVLTFVNNSLLLENKHSF